MYNIKCYSIGVNLYLFIRCNLSLYVDRFECLNVLNVFKGLIL